MKKTIACFGIMFLFLASASAYTLIRSGPAFVNPGETFTIQYTVDSAQPNLFVAYKDDIVGGCSPRLVSSSILPDARVESRTQRITFTAPPVVGNCTFDGYYYFQDGVTKNFPAMMVSVGVQRQQVQTEQFVVQSPPPENTTAVNTNQTVSENRLASLVEKFAFFHILGNAFLEGAIVFILIIFIVYKLVK